MPGEGKAPPPAKRPEDMTPEERAERLRSLQAYVEEKKYIQPGGGEILPYNSGNGPGGGFNSTIFGNEWQGPTSFVMAKPAYDVENLPPPSYDTGTGAASTSVAPRKQSVFERLKDKVHHHEKSEAHEEESRSSK